MPVEFKTKSLKQKEIGLVIVDPVKGFTQKGPLSDPKSMQPMIESINSLTQMLISKIESLPILIFLDCHLPGKPEEPYPPHCQQGSGEEEIDEKLAWLLDRPYTTVIKKDCINGFIGAQEVKGNKNLFVQWIQQNSIKVILVVGDCTDICVLDLVTTLLSARNHGILDPLNQVIVFEPGCTTYDLLDPESLGLPKTLSHPRTLFHYIGLAIMQSRGAEIVNSLKFD
jgi:nicotinamidase-related amidase